MTLLLTCISCRARPVAREADFYCEACRDEFRKGNWEGAKPPEAPPGGHLGLCGGRPL